MKIKFGNKLPTVDQCYEVHSPNGTIHIKQKYWRTYQCADAYAKILRNQHDQCAFGVRWCKPLPKKPIKILNSQ